MLANLHRKPTALERYIFLIALLDRNETLLYRTVIEREMLQSTALSEASPPRATTGR